MSGFTSALGWAGANGPLLQCGGPPVATSYARSLPSKALPLLAHAYLNDGVTPASHATFPILNRPAIKSRHTNGGFDQITIEPAAKDANGNLVGVSGIGPVWGNFTWGNFTWGGALGLQQGNVIRLTEVGGPFTGFVYSGVIESFPDARSSTGTKHEIVVSPFGWELTRVATQLVYSAPTDIAQIVRDAVALTQHCSCDTASVPLATGTLAATTGQVDFRGQKVAQVLDTMRSIAGPTWFWHCDELGRVWFQPQGSAAVYTLLGGSHYDERTSNGGDIQDRINQVLAVGGVPVGGSVNVTATVNGSSQATIGTRALDPPIHLPGITDSVALTAIANGILATLDQTWTRVQIKALPPQGIANEKHPGRIHASQPGGAMLRYWEPGVTPMTETGAMAGYVGPFITQSVEYDGLTQMVEAGSIPVTSQTDIDNLVKSWANRTVANSAQVTAAALNLPQQVLTGTIQSGAGTQVASPSGTPLPATLWRLTQQMLEAIDPAGVSRAQFGHVPVLGNSPDQWGWRAINALGQPMLDTFGPLTGGVMSSLGISNVTGGSTFTTVASADMPGSSLSVTVTPRPLNLLVFMLIAGHVSAEGNTGGSLINPGGAGSPTGSAPIGTAQDITIMAWEYLPAVPVGTYTFKLQGNISGGGITFTVDGGNMQVWQLGS